MGGVCSSGEDVPKKKWYIIQGDHSVGQYYKKWEEDQEGLPLELRLKHKALVIYNQNLGAARDDVYTPEDLKICGSELNFFFLKQTQPEVSSSAAARCAWSDC